MAKLNVSGGLSGAASGASVGASIGSVLPGVGTAIGGAIGGIGGGLLGLFGSRKKKPKRLSTFDRNQQELFDKYTQGVQGKGQFSNLFGFDPAQQRDVFQKMYAQPAYQNFQENIIPSITGQFRGGNLGNSSYLGGALGKAGTDVQRGLDAHLAQMLYQGQQSSIDRRLSAINNILGTQTFAYQKPQASPFESMLYGFSGGLGQSAGSKFSDWLNTSSGGASVPVTS